MEKKLARSLRRAAQELAVRFSNKDRARNFAGETFALERIVPLSEKTAAAIYTKEPTKKRGLAFFYHLNMGGGRWMGFFPTESHIYGMQKLVNQLQEVEEQNFQLNFEGGKNERP